MNFERPGRTAAFTAGVVLVLYLVPWLVLWAGAKSDIAETVRWLRHISFVHAPLVVGLSLVAAYSITQWARQTGHTLPASVLAIMLTVAIAAFGVFGVRGIHGASQSDKLLRSVPVSEATVGQLWTVYQQGEIDRSAYVKACQGLVQRRFVVTGQASQLCRDPDAPDAVLPPPEEMQSLRTRYVKLQQYNFDRWLWGWVNAVSAFVGLALFAVFSIRGVIARRRSRPR